MHRICLRIILLYLFLCVLTISDTVSASYDQDVENAKTLLSYDISIITQENTKVTTAWSDVTNLHNEWKALSRELQEVDIQTAREAGIEFISLNWGSLFIRLYNTPDILSEQLRLKSTSEVLDDAISTLTVSVHFFDVAVDIYEYSWEVVDLTISIHHGQITHDGVYSSPHTVPPWISWNCDRAFPTFPCWGADDCEKTFYTTYDARIRDRRVCGTETPPPGYSDPIAGCDEEYYICDEVQAEEHKVWFCAKWFWENNKRKERCGYPYRYCTNTKRDHRNAFWSLATKHEHRAEEIGDYFAEVGTSDNDPDDPDGTLANTDNSPNCDACTTALCPECPEVSSTAGVNFANLGDLHESIYTGNKAIRSVYWYVKAPGDTNALGRQVEIDIGGSATYETGLTYRIPENGDPGIYIITAYVYPYDGSDVYWISYHINVW